MLNAFALCKNPTYSLQCQSSLTYLPYWMRLPLIKYIAFSSESIIKNPNSVYYGCQMRNVFAQLPQTSLEC